jgi:hypothetical protein
MKSELVCGILTHTHTHTHTHIHTHTHSIPNLFSLDWDELEIGPSLLMLSALLQALQRVCPRRAQARSLIGQGLLPPALGNF